MGKNSLKDTINTKVKAIYYSRFMSIVVGFSCVIITLILWSSSRTGSLSDLSKEVESLSELYFNRVESRIDNIEFNLSELAGYGSPTNEQEEIAWDTRTDFYLETMVGLKNVIFVNENLVIKQVNPPNSEEYLIDSTLVMNQKNTNYTNLIFPTYNDDNLSGFILVDIDVAELILLIDFESDEDYMIQIFNDETLVGESDNWTNTNSSIKKTNSVVFENDIYSYTLSPTSQTVSNSTNYSRMILFFGLTLSIIITYVWYSRTAINERLEKLVTKKTKELSYIGYHDQLTGLFNRRYYEMKIKEFEEKKVYPFSIVLADINGLKLVNDAFGHQEGDLLLKLASKLMTMHIPKDGIVCRIGGDEFVILLPNNDEQYAEKIVSKIEKHSSEIKKENVQLSISFGVAAKHNDDKIVELFRVAEDRMYQSKLIEVPSMRSNAIDTIMQTLNEKDRYSEQHVRNVATLAKRLAQCMKLSSSDINEIHTAGLLHDIGKIIIPSTILNKQGSLNDGEYAIMKSHPEIGFRILNSSAEMRSISKVVLHHHERIDGKGYPQNLVGDTIPIKSRIISVVDAFDAMTTFRTYQPTKSNQEALEELYRCAGTQFDSEVVRIFGENFDIIVKDLKKEDIH